MNLRMVFIKFFLLNPTLIFSACSPPPPIVTPPRPSLRANLDFDYYPPASPSTNTLAILLHGGSWMAGDKAQLSEVGRFLAGRGQSVINLNYRLAPAWNYDAPLQDIVSVIQSVQADPAAYGLTPPYRLILLGFSAGGHLASQYCLTEAQYRSQPADVCISLAGIYDLQRIKEGQSDPLLTDAVNLFLGSASAKLASPLYQIKPQESTRFLLLHGTNDRVVSPAQMTDFANRLHVQSTSVSAQFIEGRDHLSIFTAIPNGDSVAQQILDFLRP